MRAVNSGNNYHIYDNSVKLYNELPAQIYQVEFAPLAGYRLSKYTDIDIKEKVYGVHQSKVDKVMNNFEGFSRSLGVILSGDKGIGKSLFAKMLCQQAVEKGYPVLICNGYSSGIAQFLDSLDQPLVVLFDEFDKTFRKSSDGSDVQAEMLSLFDGISQNKKLFCVTCNSLSGLNDYLVNRPGRFHYHFRFGYPNRAEIEQYMKDHLNEDKWSEISKIANFAEKVELNYDCLRAIAFELNLCATFEEAISDLNILKPDRGMSTTVYVCFSDGSKTRKVVQIDPFSDVEETGWFGNTGEANDDYIRIKFTPTDAIWSEADGAFYLPAAKLKITDDLDDRDEDDFTNKQCREYAFAHRASHVVGLMLRRNFRKDNIRFFDV